MAGYPEYWHTARTPNDDLIDTTAYFEEQYSVEPGDGSNRPWATAIDPQFSSQGYLSQVQSSTQDNYPTIGQNQMPSYQDSNIQRGYGGPAHSLSQPGYIDPAQLSNSGASYGQSSSLGMFDDRYNSVEVHDDHQVTPLAHMIGQQSGQLCAPAVFRNEHETSYYEEYGQSSMVFAGHDEVVERNVPTLDNVDHLPDTPIQRSDNVFVPGVLERRQDHEEQLVSYMDQLLGVLGTSTDDLLVPSNLDMAPASNATSFHGTIGDSSQTVIQPPCFDTIREQGSRAIGNAEQITEQRIPSWYVTEDAPVVVEPEVSDSSSRDTSNKRLHPSASSLVPNAPSSTNTDASSPVLYCSVDDCKTSFTGRFGKGNLRRHHRQKHNGQTVLSHCRDAHCGKSFKRTDARLKHHRKAHPELNIT